MTDTTHEAFEAYMRAAGKERANDVMFERDAKGDYVLPTIYATFYGWVAATERATAVERERCAVVCEYEQAKTESTAKLCRVVAELLPYDICAAAIRQGGTP